MTFRSYQAIYLPIHAHSGPGPRQHVHKKLLTHCCLSVMQSSPCMQAAADSSPCPTRDSSYHKRSSRICCHLAFLGGGQWQHPQTSPPIDRCRTLPSPMRHHMCMHCSCSGSSPPAREAPKHTCTCKVAAAAYDAQADRHEAHVSSGCAISANFACACIMHVPRDAAQPCLVVIPARD